MENYVIGILTSEDVDTHLWGCGKYTTQVPDEVSYKFYILQVVCFTKKRFKEIYFMAKENSAERRSKLKANSFVRPSAEF